MDCDDAPVTPGASRATCAVTILGRQHVKVAFGGSALPDDQPPRRQVTFRARTTGTGKGTIRGRLDCGTRCSTTVEFRTPVTLVADPDPGSRFVRWNGACGTDATCTLQAVATAVSARFEPKSATTTTTGSGDLGKVLKAPAGRFLGLVGKVTPRGKGAGRRIAVQIGVSARASVRTKLVKGGRSILNRVHTLKRGITTLQLRVPRRTRAGSYRLRITIRGPGGGAPVRDSRKVPLRR